MIPNQLTATAIQVPDALHGCVNQAACSLGLRFDDSHAFYFENKRDLFANRTTLNERQNVTQKPSQVPSADRPLVRPARSFRWSLPKPYAPAPSLDVEIGDIAICVGETYPSLRKVPRTASSDRYGAFTVKAPGGPTQRAHRRLLERTCGLVSQAVMQPLRLRFFVSCSEAFRATQATVACSVDSDVKVLLCSTVPVHAVCLVSRCKSHNMRIT